MDTVGEMLETNHFGKMEKKEKLPTTIYKQHQSILMNKQAKQLFLSQKNFKKEVILIRITKDLFWFVTLAMKK